MGEETAVRLVSFLILTTAIVGFLIIVIVLRKYFLRLMGRQTSIDYADYFFAVGTLFIVVLMLVEEKDPVFITPTPNITQTIIASYLNTPPTPTPTTIVPTETPYPLDIALNTYQVNTEGVIVGNYKISMSSIGVGNIELAYPRALNLNESALVRANISLDSNLVVVSSGLPASTLLDTPVPLFTPMSPNIIYDTRQDRIRIYPLMRAELTGNNFDISPSDSDASLTKDFAPPSPMVWDWIVIPREEGFQTLYLTFLIPTIINDKWEFVRSNTVHSLPLQVRVLVTPTSLPSRTPVNTITPRPTPTPIPTVTPSSTPTLVPTATPVPPPPPFISEQLQISIINGVFGIIIAIIGLFGVYTLGPILIQTFINTPLPQENKKTRKKSLWKSFRDFWRL